MRPSVFVRFLFFFREWDELKSLQAVTSVNPHKSLQVVTQTRMHLPLLSSAKNMTSCPTCANKWEFFAGFRNWETSYSFSPSPLGLGFPGGKNTTWQRRDLYTYGPSGNHCSCGVESPTFVSLTNRCVVVDGGGRVLLVWCGVVTCHWAYWGCRVLGMRRDMV